MVEISVIIPTRNRRGLLVCTLQSLCRQFVSSNKYEIIVLDNGSTDDTSTEITLIAEQSENTIRYFFDPTPGLLTGRHRGALEAKGDILVFVDDDIEAAPGWLQAIVDTFADPSVQLVGGRNLPRYEVEPPRWIEAFKWTPPYGGWALGYLSLLDLGDRMLDIDANYIWGLNFAIRRQALFDLGGFHPDCIPDHLQHFQGDGETGLTMKANERGYRAVYQPRAVVYHRIPAGRLTPEYFERRAFYQGVCDSYADIRRAGGVVPLPWETQPESSSATIDGWKARLSRYARHLLEHGRSFLRRMLTPSIPVKFTAREDDELRQIKQRVQAAYRLGYEFHHNAVKQEPLLLKWVLRKDYWDYRLPDVRCPVERPRL